MYKEATLKKYITDLSAKLPAPGGGSAAALTAAQGAALVSMVVNFTIGKANYLKYEQELKDILELSEKLKDEFLNLVDLDIIAFKSKNIRDSLNVPFMVARLCYECMKLCPPLVTKGNVNLISDLAVAAALLEAAYSCAYFNVEINLKSLGDKKLAFSMRKELLKKDKLMKKIRQDTEERVGKIISAS